MDWPARIVLVRHAESEENVVSSDDSSFGEKANHAFALTSRGRRQAEAASAYLARYGIFDAYFCSTYQRTRETLWLMYPEVSPVIDSRLNELWRGIWHTMPRERIAQLYPEEIHIREREGEYHYRPPGGQNCQDVEVMIHSFIHSLRIDYAGKNVFISAHGNWMLLFWRIMLNREAGEFETRERYKNCALSVYERNGNAMQLVTDNMVPFSEV